MCGIFSINSLNRNLEDSRFIEGTKKALNKLSHRGPDGSGILVKPSAILGHRRLSIIDIAGGQQPMMTDDGKIGITYNGEFMWPVDLEKMYCSVDVVWGCYPYGDSAPGNWQWAKTNRFYESCFFRKPLITLLNSADAAVVSKLNIGFSVDLSDINKTVEFLMSKLSKEYLASLTNNLGQVPEQSYLYMDDHDRLIKSIEMV